jgi:hypothetical protein
MVVEAIVSQREPGGRNITPQAQGSGAPGQPRSSQSHSGGRLAAAFLDINYGLVLD